MSKINHLGGDSDWINLEFVERERTPERAMKLGSQMHVSGLSLSVFPNRGLGSRIELV